MKLLGVDYGRRRIGIAVSDESGRVVRSLPTVDRQKQPNAISALCTIIQQEQPQILIVGLPLDHNGAETVMSEEARAFAARLAEASRKPIRFVDESSTSQAATQLLRYRSKKQRRDKAAVDRIAACLILETYIREAEELHAASSPFQE